MKVLFFVLLCFLSSNVYGQDVRTYIPKNAYDLFSDVRIAASTDASDIITPFYFGGLIEQESCISVTHAKCWNASSKLQTSRETGIGLFQITKAFTDQGVLRFDTLGDLRKKYPVELKDLTWDNIENRPDLQIIAGTLLLRDNFNSLNEVPSFYERLAMADSAYNGGLGNVNKARTACGLAAGCDPNYWFNNVENYLPQSKAALYGNRSAYEINREHVVNSLTLRLWKYRPYIY